MRATVFLPFLLCCSRTPAEPPTTTPTVPPMGMTLADPPNKLTDRGIIEVRETPAARDPAPNTPESVGPSAKPRTDVSPLAESPMIEGSLPAEAIKQVINEHKNDVRYCYEVELQRNQHLEGRITVRWVIGATGAVAQAAIKTSTMNNANIENCFVSRIKTWRFPAPSGGSSVEVNYPFVFKAS
jgi:TonB family protein